MALRDLFLAPADDGPAPAPAASDRRPGATPALAVLAPERDLTAVAAAAGIALAREAPAVLVHLHVASLELPPPLIPPRAAASRLARSLTARAVLAQPRGRLAIAHSGAERADGEPHPLGEDEPGRTAAARARGGGPGVAVAARALAAAGDRPTVLGVAARDREVDGLLATQDAILVVLPPEADARLVDLALAGAARLARAERVPVRLDPVSRALALGGVRPPGAIARAVRGLVG